MEQLKLQIFRDEGCKSIAKIIHSKPKVMWRLSMTVQWASDINRKIQINTACWAVKEKDIKKNIRVEQESEGC